MSSLQLEYELGTLKAEELQRLTDEIWVALQSDQELRATAKDEGVDLEKIDFKKSNPIKALQKGSGVDPLATTILVSIATSVVSGVILDLWRNFILNRIREKEGNDAIKKEI